MAKNRSTSKKTKKFLTGVIIPVAIIVAALFLCYFLYEPFRIKADNFFANLFNKDYSATVPDNEKKGENELRIHYLDVQQGDSIFIELPDGTVMLIDSGDKKTQRATYIIDYIKSLGYKDTIDYLMLTHSDSDHVGNMVSVLNAFEVEKAYVPDIENKGITATYQKFYTALENETYFDETTNKQTPCQIEISLLGKEILSENETDKFFIAFLNQSSKDTVGSPYYEINHTANPDAAKKNNVSPIMLLEYMGKRAVFTGDAFSKGEDEVLKNVNAGVYDSGFSNSINLREIDILKVGHHGSDTSSTANFINLLRPKYSVISVGAGNKYNHPSGGVISRLQGIDSAIYRTDNDGLICATIYPDETKAINFTFLKGVTAEVAEKKLEIIEIRLIIGNSYEEYMKKSQIA